MIDDPLRRRSRVEAMEARAEAVLRADDIYLRMVIWASAALICGVLTFLVAWELVFPTLLFAAAWVAAADNQAIWLKVAADWQQYLDENEL